MRPDPKKRLSVSASQSPLVPVADAFGPLAGLDSATLPAGPEVVKPAGPEWKLGRVVLRKETAHRGGKTVIVVHDFATHLPLSVIERIAKLLRAACGCGGTVKDREIEIQGGQIARIRSLLEKEGFQVAGVRE